MKKTLFTFTARIFSERTSGSNHRWSLPKLAENPQAPTGDDRLVLVKLARAAVTTPADLSDR